MTRSHDSLSSSSRPLASFIRRHCPTFDILAYIPVSVATLYWNVIFFLLHPQLEKAKKTSRENFLTSWQTLQFVSESSHLNGLSLFGFTWWGIWFFFFFWGGGDWSLDTCAFVVYPTILSYLFKPILSKELSLAVNIMVMKFGFCNPQNWHKKKKNKRRRRSWSEKIACC